MSLAVGFKRIIKGWDQIKEKKNKQKMKVFSITLILISGLCVLYSEFKIYKESKEYENISRQFIIAEKNEVINLSVKPIEEYKPEKKAETVIEEISMRYDWKTLQDINNDIAGWLFFPETEINYPVVKGMDNSFYLNNSFHKKKNRIGCLFFDYRNFNYHDNQIIYGHNMGSGKTAMFSTLIKWEDFSWYQNHREFYYTPLKEETQKYVIFSVIKMSIKEINQIEYTIRDFSNEHDFVDWIRKIKERSVIDTDIMPQYGNKILTLSTCDRRVYGLDGRLVILAVKI